MKKGESVKRMIRLGKKHGRAKGKGLIPFLLMILLPPLAVIPVVNRLLSDPDPQDHRAWVRAALKLRNYPAAKAHLARLIEEEPLSPSHHVRYVSVHFRLPDSGRDDLALLDTYESWARDSDPNRVRIGHLVRGQAYLEMQQPDLALRELEPIQPSRLRHLHTFRGRAYAQLGDFQKARAAFEREIANRGDLAGALRELADLHLIMGDTTALEALYGDRTLRPYLPIRILRRLAMRTGRAGRYFGLLAAPLRRSGNPVGIAGALLILIVWVTFLRRMDPFEPEKLSAVLLTLGLGMLMPFVSLVLYDLFEMVLGLRLGDSPGRDLLFCILGIGLIEESVKLLPVLFMIGCTKEVNESIDYLIYASLGALGFSFVENILYFHDASLYIIKERGMLCCVGHMFYTSLVLYGLVLARYGRRGSVGGNLALCFALACVFHGIYDFFLLSDLPRPAGAMLAMGLALLQAVLYVRMLNNTLNQSEYFDFRRAGRFASLRQTLGAALVGIVLFEYVAVSLRYGPTLTYGRFMPLIGFTWFLVFFFASTLGTYTLRPNYWLPWRKQDS